MKWKTRFLNQIKGLLALTLILTSVTMAACALVSAASLGDGFMPFITSDSIQLRSPAAKAVPTLVEIGGFAIESLSVAEDLEIRVTTADGQLAQGIAFAFRVISTSHEDVVFEVIDEDMDGTVYIEKIDAGDYRIETVPQKGFIMPEPVVTTVAAKMHYGKIDVSEKVKTTDEIDEKNDDAHYGEETNNNGGTPPPPPSSDTVEYVESRSETVIQTIEKPLLDEKGNQVYKYRPQLAPGGYLVEDAGKTSDILAVLSAEGYIIGAKRLIQATEGGEPAYTDCSAEVIDAAGTPLMQGERYKYRFDQVALTITEEVKTTVYYGWQVLEGRTYYFDKNGNKVTGKQTIQGIEYFFSDSGVRGGSVGIDVSTWQENIDWKKVREAGIDFAFVRLGFRGYQSGALVLDNCYHKNMQGAIAAGIRVGVYFFTQAINEKEAIEEASMCLQYVAQYKLSLPIVIDIESAGSSSARTNNLNADMLTRIAIAFCETIRSSGYTPGVYANKYYLTSKLIASRLSGYVIWLAHYTSAERSDYSGKYDIWQHTSTGKVNGIIGAVDMNYSYIF